jgi:hypothetical protein
MPYLFAMFLYAFNIGCIFHVLRTGRDRSWIYVLVIAPGVGSAAYFLMEILPEIQQSRTARKVAGGVADAVAPDRRVRALQDQLEITDTADTRRLLAEELMRLNRAHEAVKIVEPSLVGVHAQDPALLLILAEALFKSGEPSRALATLDRLQEHNPGFQSRDGHMLYALCLEALGRDQEAIEEYRSLIGYALGPEAQVRLGVLLKKQGQEEQARIAFAEAVRTYGKRRRQLDPQAREWLVTAERNLA